MPIDRPTFDESWYRVAPLRPRLVAAVQARRQEYYGQIWWVITDPANNEYFRISDAAYSFLGLLNGRRTVQEVWQHCLENHGDDAPTQGEVVQLLGQLYTSNLLRAELPLDVSGLFERYRKRRHREAGGLLMNALFPRFPLFNPDRFLGATVPMVGWMFSWVGLALWAVLLVTGFHAVVGQWDDFLRDLGGVVDPRIEKVVMLFLTFAVIKAIHELGHAYACKHFGRLNGGGGEVYKLGIMLLVLVPTPYVDASSAWAFRNKWHRAVVGAAGIYFELAVAAVAAILWSRTGDTSMLRSLASNAIFIASVSTLLFNANPLLRYDGYYILADLLETPNLAQRSKEYLYYLVRRYAFGAPGVTNPAGSWSERFWLLLYAITSGVYRIFISIAITLFIASKLFFIGMILALVSVVGWLCVPLVKFVKYLASSGELSRQRPRAVLVTAAVSLLVLVPVCLVPVQEYGRAEGVVEPRQLAVIYMPTDAFVTAALPSGTMVQGGEVVTLRNDKLVRERDRLLAQIDGLVVTLSQAHTQDPATAQARTAQLQAAREQLALVQGRVDDLQIHSDVSGLWIAPDIKRVTGAYVRQNQRLGVVIHPGEVRIRAIADQLVGPRLESDINRLGLVEVRIKGKPEALFEARIERILPAGSVQLPSAALGYMSGGEMPTATDDPRGERAAERFFEVWLTPQPQAPRLLPGQRVIVRIDLGRRPLIMQWYHQLRQLLQRRFQV